MAEAQSELLQGTLELLILKTLALEPMHGWGIAKRIGQLSKNVLAIQQGSLYPALYRLQDRGLIRSKKGVSDEGRAVKIYRLTPRGRRRLEDGTASWRLVSTAVEHVLQAT